MGETGSGLAQDGGGGGGEDVAGGTNKAGRPWETKGGIKSSDYLSYGCCFPISHPKFSFNFSKNKTARRLSISPPIRGLLLNVQLPRQRAKDNGFN